MTTPRNDGKATDVTPSDADGECARRCIVNTDWDCPIDQMIDWTPAALIIARHREAACRELREENERLKEQFDKHCATEEQLQERDALRAENERLRKDGARLDCAQRNLEFRARNGVGPGTDIRLKSPLTSGNVNLREHLDALAATKENAT